MRRSRELEASGYISQNFLNWLLAKILISLGLDRRGIRYSLQNIERKGFAGKILWSKGLAR
jgi:hypothetical protein